MASVVEICNVALSLCGDDGRITSLSPPDGSAQADHCSRFYPLARDTFIESHAWRFATRRATLALFDTAELPDTWHFAYALPSPMLAPISILMPQTIGTAFNPFVVEPDQLPTNNPDTNTQDFIIETLMDGSLALFTNVEDAVLRYVVSVTDTTKFTPLFAFGLSRLLASMLAGVLIKGKEGMKVSAEHREFFEKVDSPRARAADSRGQKMNVYNNFTPDGLKARL